MICKKCGAQNDDEIKVCASCGEALEAEENVEEAKEAAVETEIQEAAEASAKISEETAEISESADEATEEISQEEENAENAENADEAVDGAEEGIAEEPKKKSPLGKIIAIAVVIVAVLLGVKFVPGLFNDKEVDAKNLPVVYVKGENTLMIKAPGKAEAITLAKNHTGENVKVTKDGKTVFYTKVDEKKGETVLYKRATDKKDAKEIKVEAGVEEYTVTSDGKFAVYIKSGNLYVHNFKKAKKIADKVQWYEVADDGKTLVYYTDKPEITKKATKDAENEVDEDKAPLRDYYRCSLKGSAKPVKIASEVENVIFAQNPENGKIQYNKEIHYLKDKTLYYQKEKKSAVKVLKDVATAEYLEEKLYAVKTETTKVNYEDLIEDDCEEEDAKIAPPVEEDFQKEDESGNKVLDEEKYNEAYENYTAQAEKIQYRTYIRQYLQSQPIEKKNSTLYIIDGGKAKVVSKDFIEIALKNRLAIKEGAKNKGSKVKLSTIESEEDYANVMTKVTSGMSGDTVFYAIQDGKMIELKGVSEEATYFYVNDAADTLLCMEDMEYDEQTFMASGKLVRYKITSKGVSDRKELVEKAMNYSMTKDGNVIIESKDGEKTVLGIYAKKYEKIAEDGYLYGEIDGAIFYYANINDETLSADFMKYVPGKKAVKLDSDVYGVAVDVRSADKCYYIKKFDTAKGSGELYMYDTKATLIDKDVSSIVNIY